MSVAACSLAGEPRQLGTLAARQDLPFVEVMATVTSVTDGDSFRASVDGDNLEVRLLGINAPESNECFGTESTAWLTATIDGKKIGLAPESELDQFDRVVARAVIGNIYVNVAAVATGHSVVVSAVEVDRAVLIEAEESARLDGIGIWGEDICGARGAKASLEIVDIEYNPPGPDEVETLTIENTGDEPVDLSGFVLRDESSVNRFELPFQALEPADSLAIVVTDCDPLKASRTIEWCSGEPVWNNDGDTALLLDKYGRIVAFFRY